MQIALASAAAARPVVLASQTIDVTTRRLPSGSVQTWSTERELRLAGNHDGLALYTSADDAIAAARALSAGDMPGLAVVAWRTGFRLFDVHASSRTYVASSPAPGAPNPGTREIRRSTVPFAAGNVRPADNAHRNSPAVVRNSYLVALIDGPRTFRPDPTSSWAGQPRLVEV